MSTPEGKVKSRINKILDKYKGRIYKFMPVPGGYGKSTLDYLGIFRGRGFAIEAKAPGKVPTPRQEQIADDIRAGGGRVFVIDGDTTELELWLESMEDGDEHIS